MAIAAAAVGAGIASGTTLLSGGLQWYLAESAQRDALRESRRAEKLRIAFAEKENKRLQGNFSREMGLQEKRFDFDKNQQRFQNTAEILNRISEMHNSNLDNLYKIKDSFGSRSSRRA